MKISEKILTLRKKEGLSQEDLANKLDVSRQTVYKWESDLAMPEIEKIKNIAKMFNVSFDYLMDDEIESYEKRETKKKAKLRTVFYTDETLSTKHADIDHGYVESRKSKARRADEYFDSRIEEMNETLESAGATEIIRIQPDASIAFFYNQNNHEFGFYYAGKIQFVCPIENYQDFQIDSGSAMNINTRTPVFGLGLGGGGVSGVGFGSIPSSTTIESSYISTTLYYRDKEGIKELELGFSVSNMYLADTVKNVDDLIFTKNVLKDTLLKNLRAIQGTLQAQRSYVRDILDGTIKVENIDVDYYTESQEAQEERYRQYLDMLEADAKVDNRNKLIKIGALVAVGAAVLVIGFFIIKGWFGF